MAPFNKCPKDVYPLIAVTTMGVSMMTLSAWHALFASPEVHLRKATRKDELLEDPGLPAKGSKYRATSFFGNIARLFEQR